MQEEERKAEKKLDRAWNKAMEKTKGKEKNGQGKRELYRPGDQPRRPPEGHLSILKGHPGQQQAPTSPWSLTPALVPKGSREPLGQAAGPPPASPARPALIGQSP